MIIIHDSSYRDRMRVNESELDPEWTMLENRQLCK